MQMSSGERGIPRGRVERTRQPVLSRLATRKKALATIGVGSLAPVLDVVLPTFESYARRHGYRLVIGDGGDALSRPPAWGKVALLRRLLNKVDEVLWIDADAVILDETIDLAADVAPDAYQALVRHVTNDGEVPNTGVWFIRGERGRQLLDAVWQCEEYIDHNWWENAAVIDLLGYSLDHPIRPLRKTPWQEGTQWLSPKWNAVPPWVPQTIPCHIRHYAGWKWAGLTPDDLVTCIRAEVAGTAEPTHTDSKTQADPHEYRSWDRDRIIGQLDAIFHRIGERGGFVVQHGPFAGMTYLSSAQAQDLLRGSAFVPKLVGSYEAELHEIVARIVAERYDLVVNVGCGEGYYAIGLARLLHEAHIYAFDIDGPSREWCAELANLNDVTEKVTIAGACGIEDLSLLIDKRALLVVDCEGNELDLLQPNLLPQLAQCDVIVEFHDFINPVISHSILERFAPTHAITVIDSEERNPADYPVLHTLAQLDQRLAIDEFLPAGMQWAFMTAKSLTNLSKHP